jgi:hypothetical protein
MAPKISEEKLLAAVTKTIKVITNTSNVRVELDSFSRNESSTFVTCWAVLEEIEFNSTLELLNASMNDTTFARNMSSILGVAVNMSAAHWMYSTDNTTHLNVMNNGGSTGSTAIANAGASDGGEEDAGVVDDKMRSDIFPRLFIGKSVNQFIFHINQHRFTLLYLYQNLFNWLYEVQFFQYYIRL